MGWFNKMLDKVWFSYVTDIGDDHCLWLLMSKILCEFSLCELCLLSFCATNTDIADCIIIPISIPRSVNQVNHDSKATDTRVTRTPSS